MAGRNQPFRAENNRPSIVAGILEIRIETEILDNGEPRLLIHRAL
jgi:hypothetical protein